ncbi:F0F1 ATP synthase subunit epsilon [Campylobacter sp. MIT 12-8780]|uniref:ATP synthase F1 subunit epsilon n=1 Tax=unclassified Campylobacter TaxID=2593542 RepID=UPI00115CEAC6|nr:MULTISPECIES: ATP synthase F1 subunit epsilon [unclassified Campylobacter]NDJ27375.1 F0F1 ATP synthase subunit epsilon [Campylobacter sp. MIT 19-121]TQR40234.1 F0F1 ATP synthase subunit epsilon [Campylobacter sp. MIT 12-8780]
MSDLMHLEVVTPMGMIYEGEVRCVVLPGSEGEFGVLKGHASLISSLKAGVIDIEKADSKHELIAVDSGYAEVNEFKTTVLAKGAVAINADENSEIAQNLNAAKELLRSASSDSVALASTFANIDSKAGIK